MLVGDAYLPRIQLNGCTKEKKFAAFLSISRHSGCCRLPYHFQSFPNLLIACECWWTCSVWKLRNFWLRISPTENVNSSRYFAPSRCKFLRYNGAKKQGTQGGKRMFGFWCSENPHNSLDIRVVISSCLWCNLHLYIEKIEMLKISFTYISLRNEQEKWTLECNPNRRLGRCGVRRHKSDTSRNSYADSNWTRFQFELLRILFSGFHSH